MNQFITDIIHAKKDHPGNDAVKDSLAQN